MRRGRWKNVHLEGIKPRSFESMVQCLTTWATKISCPYKHHWFFFQMTRQRVADFRVLRRTAPSSSVKNRSGPARWLGTPATGGSNFWGQPGGSAATMGPGCHKEFHSVVSHLWTSNYFIWAPNSCTIASVTEACLVGSLPACLLAFAISAR